MKSDPRAAFIEDAAVAGAHPEGADAPPGRPRFLRIGRIVLLAVVPLLYLVVASLLALGIVRVGADLRLGIDPFTTGAARPRLSQAELAFRSLAVDAVRQFLLAVLVIGFVCWRDGAAWRRTLALAPPAMPRVRMGRLWLLMLVWPVVHIAWVTGTAEALHVSFGRGVQLSPLMGTGTIACWLLYVTLLAPAAEELLFRGETFARASAFLRPSAAITATALLFCLFHLSEAGLARPISLLPLAVTLGWLRWRTGRLWPCILLHGWSNGALIAYLLWPSTD